MRPVFVHIGSRKLKPRQKEAYNFQKVSGVLADYGYLTIRLADDWDGADFIAQHIDGIVILRVQLKGRLTVKKEYQGKDLYVCFPGEGESWYVVPHDALLKWLEQNADALKSKSWQEGGAYSWRELSAKCRAYLTDFQLTPHRAEQGSVNADRK